METGPLKMGLLVVSMVFALLLGAHPVRAQSLSTLHCAVLTEPFEYTLADTHGPRPEVDRGLCKAVAVALKIPAVSIELADEAAAVDALQAGKVDLIPTISADLTHSTDPRLTLAPPILLDGVGLLAPAATRSAESLAGQKICFFSGTETETALHTWFGRGGLDFIPYPFSEEGEMQAAFTSGNCPAMAGDFSRLATVRAGLNNPERFHLLPEVLAPDPLASATRREEVALARVVLAVEQMLLNAEILGVSKAALARKADDAAVERLLGETHELGPAADLDNGWPRRVLEAVGSYAELIRRLPVSLPQPSAMPLK